VRPATAIGFAGAPLAASRVVRFVFMDEGGISKHEPHIVVGGVFVHGDKQLVPLEEALQQIVERHIPEPDRDGFVFHTKDIWSGAKYFKDRERWPLNKRLDILKEIALIPKHLRIPIVFHQVERAQIERDGPLEWSKDDVSIYAHAIAFCRCALLIEKKMRSLWPEEVAQLVAEDNPQAREAIKFAHSMTRNKQRLLDRLNAEKQKSALLDYVPLDRIRGSVHFAEKTESRPLQLADFCTFIIRGFLRGNQHSRALYELLRPRMLVIPIQDKRPIDDLTAFFCGPAQG
jgi:hypothetical protein